MKKLLMAFTTLTILTLTACTKKEETKVVVDTPASGVAILPVPSSSTK